VFQPDQPIRVLREGDTLTGDPVLPDFQLPLSELFAEIGE
jgi:Uma2 family endonuclease